MHATVIDLARGERVPDQTVVVVGARVAAVGPSAGPRRLRPPAGARVVDGRGGYLIPGLWDMHVHVLGRGREATLFPLLLAHGVTGVRNMHAAVPLDSAVRVRAAVAAGQVLGPRLVLSGPLVDGPTPWAHAGALVVATPEAARRAVDSLADEGADFIKVYDALAPAAYLAVTVEAARRGLAVAGHIPRRVRPEQAAAAGQRSVEHLYGLVPACGGGPPGAGAGRAAAPDSGRCRAVVDAFGRHGTYQTPTLALHRAQADPAAVLADAARMTLVAPATRERWRGLFAATIRSDSARRRLTADGRARLGAVGALHRAGVPILAGTDVGNPLLVPGASLHDELALLVEAGLTPLAALRAATLEPARYLRATDSLGSVSAGALADLVLLDADPLVDIGNARRMRAVIANGRLLDRPALQALRTDAALRRPAAAGAP